jgi:hypothetical protein
MPMTEHIKDILSSDYPDTPKEFHDFVEKEQHDNDFLSNPAFTKDDVERLYRQFMGMPAVNHINAKKNTQSIMSEREIAEKNLADAKAALEALDEQAVLAKLAEDDAKEIRENAQAEADKIIADAKEKAAQIADEKSPAEKAKSKASTEKAEANSKANSEKNTKGSKKDK